MAIARTSVKLSGKNRTFVSLTYWLPFLVSKGSRVLEKKVNETQVSKTVFGRLNLKAPVNTISKRNGLRRLVAVYIDNEVLF